MPYATCFYRFESRKKKLKTILDFPILLKQLTPKTQIKLTSKEPIKSTDKASHTPNNPIHSPIETAVEARTKIQQTKPLRKSIIRIKPRIEEKKKEIQVLNRSEKFNAEMLLSKWKLYAENMKRTSGGFTSSIMVNCEPKLQEDNTTVHLIFKNETNEIEFNRLASGLLEHLKNELKNDSIKFTTEVNQAKAKKTLYTNKEKFDYLTEKHPQLQDWQDKLRLELK